MKKLLSKNFATFAIAMIIAISLEAIPNMCVAQPTAQDVARTFIESALPVDLSKYNITLKGQMTIGFTDSLTYALNSKESSFVVHCQIQNKILKSCTIDGKNGSIISDKQYTNIVDAAKGFLEKYQHYTKIDSSNMIIMLEKLDATKNSTKTIGNSTLAISNVVSFGEELTIFKWSTTINGADYPLLQFGFQRDGNFEFLNDNRRVYSIGDISVSITSEQAIDTAMKYIQSYSYKVPNNYTVSGFNVTENLSTARLETYPINSTELRPYWNVKLYLNQTYPGNVRGFSVYVWANSGDAFSCTNIAYGGLEDATNIEPTPSALGKDNAQSTLSERNPSSQDAQFVFAITIAIIGFSIASAAIIVKRKK